MTGSMDIDPFQLGDQSKNNDGVPGRRQGSPTPRRPPALVDRGLNVVHPHVVKVASASKWPWKWGSSSWRLRTHSGDNILAELGDKFLAELGDKTLAELGGAKRFSRSSGTKLREPAPLEFALGREAENHHEPLVRIDEDGADVHPVPLGGREMTIP